MKEMRSQRGRMPFSGLSAEFVDDSLANRTVQLGMLTIFDIQVWIAAQTLSMGIKQDDNVSPC